jgi:hypothetical protein
VPLLTFSVLLSVAAAILPLPVAHSEEAARSAPPPNRPFISESAQLQGLAPGAVFPFLDSTPFFIRSAHVAVTDDTSECAAGAAAPDNLQVLVGVAGGTLVPVLDETTNTGISTVSGQCVFHVSIVAGKRGIPAQVTDIVVLNAGDDPLGGTQTATASAVIQGLSSVDHVLAESAILAGLAPGAVYPYVDTTPYSMDVGHVAITDDTSDCTAGAAPPANMRVLIGEAGGTLVNVMTATANTGISTTSGQCVFHATFSAGEGGLPDRITDVAVLNAGDTALSGVNTITVMTVATRSRAHSETPAHQH